MKKTLLISSLLALSACTSYHTGKKGMQISSGINHNLSASIDVGNKVTGTAVCSEFLFFIKSAPEKQAYIPEMVSKVGNQAYDECTAGAVYDAISKNDSDILVEPQFTTVKDGFLCTRFGCLFGNTKIIVTGYSAKIKSIH